MTVGTDTWVTVAYADSYVSGKYGEAAWPPLPLTDKEKLLITAFRRLVNKFGLSPTATAENIKQAQVEMALFILHYNTDIDKRGALQAMGVKSFSLGGFSENYADAGSYFIPPEVEDLLGGSVKPIVVDITRPLDD